jgi:parallel beta-helix repeat protein
MLKYNIDDFMSASEEDTYSIMFSSLRHPIRRKILRTLLLVQSCSFSNLQKEINIESSHLTYHIESLGSLLMRTEDAKYCLSALGQAAAATMKQVEDAPKINSHFLLRSRHSNAVLKALTIMLLCGLVGSLLFSSLAFFRYTESEKSYNILDRAYTGLDNAYYGLNLTFNALSNAYEQLNKTNVLLQTETNDFHRIYSTSFNQIQSNRVYDVRTGSTYSTIQTAINAAENGTTLIVSAGTYYEQVVLNKSLSLVGVDEQRTIIDGSAILGDPRNYQTGARTAGNTVAINVTADASAVSGFTIRNATTGIVFESCTNAIVIGNNLTLNVHAITLDDSNLSLISDNLVYSNFVGGIELFGAFNNTVSGNTVMSTWSVLLDGVQGDGIHLSSSFDNTITTNAIQGSGSSDVFLQYSSNNIFRGNTIPMNEMGPRFREDSSGNNTFFENNFLSNSPCSLLNLTSSDHWSYQEKGNYWSDYNGTDIDADGVGDTNLPWHMFDYFPLISPENPVQIVWDNQAFPTMLMSNCTVSSLVFDQSEMKMSFFVSGLNGTKGYFNLSLPRVLLSGPWTILLDGTDVTSQTTIIENATETTIDLVYNESSHGVQIIGTNVVPEYSSLGLLMALFMTLNAVFLVLARNSHRRKLAPDSDNSEVP